ncbi:MAG TPA: glycosyl hydrolase [Terriglobia bacterium]|nr:glycosyl hydrolase [Terriglobia bacterium]
MFKMTRRDFLEVTGAGLSALALKDGSMLSAQPAELSGALAPLYQKFLDPDRKYSIRPFWFWNGKLTGEELGRQIRQMVENGVYGAYAHNRDGLETRYMSEEWWQALGGALQASKEAGFSLCMVDEFEWPSGEARDYWMPGVNKSHVVEANPEFRSRRMRSTESIVQGPKRWSSPLAEKTVAVVAGKRLGPDRLDGSTLQAVAWETGAKEVSWDVPEGEWLITAYDLVPAMPNGGTVDLMSREAIATFIKIYYEEFYKRYGQYFGNAMPATFADHEGSYGDKLPWTPRLFETFRRKAGYDLVPHLPGLIYDIGPMTEKLHCDLLDTISELYSDSFWKQVSDWCDQHNIYHTGHVWEESLFWGAAWQGDFYRVQRSMSTPGCDTLVEWARESVWLREVASVAAFEGKHVVCENQGVLGSDSYLSPEMMRRVSNCLGAWDIGEFVPHAFNYDLTRTNYPPDWFRGQPYLPWFHFYADQMRRISFVNCEGQRLSDLVVLYPQVSIWGQSASAFRNDDFTHLLGNANWSPDAVETSEQYADLKMRLTEARYDFMVADDYYLAKSEFAGGRLRINKSEFQLLILPPMSTTRRSTAARVRDYYRAGGTVIALRRLPYTSVESGRDDPELKAIWEEVFDLHSSAEPYVIRKSASGGRSYWVPGYVTDLVEVIREVLDPDIELVEGPADNLYAMHKRNAGVDLYWVVNDKAEPRTHVLRFKAKGRPEKWEAPTGKRSPLFYETQGDKTLVRLALGPWDAAYVVFDPTGPTQPLALAATNLEEFHVLRADEKQVVVLGRGVPGDKTGHVELQKGQTRFRGEYQSKSALPLEISSDWNVTVEAPSIDSPYAQVREDSTDRGLKERWYAKSGDKASWNPLWLAPQMRSIRKWNAIGLFPNPDDRGLEEAYAPESDERVDYAKDYIGKDGEQLHWVEFNSADDSIAPPGGNGTIEVAGGPYGADSYIVDYGRVLRAPVMQGTVYLQTNVYHPQGGEAVMLLGAPHPTTVFVNHEKVYSRFMRPLYFDPIDGFATRIPLTLKSGWNSILIKFLHNSPDDGKAPECTCRIEQANGAAIEGLVSNSRIIDDPQRAPQGYRWLSFAIPRVARALRVPPLREEYLVFVGDKQVPAAAEIPLPRGARTVTLRVSAREVLDHPLAFSTAAAMLSLGTWKAPGLEHFSGTMVYEKTVDVPAALLTERVLLDCGVVGVCAEAWVNDKGVGKRPWGPYVFDVTEQLHPGKNQIKVRVVNTEANARAVGTWRSNLERIDVNGWHGPARLVPFVEREIVCEKL